MPLISSDCSAIAKDLDGPEGTLSDAALTIGDSCETLRYFATLANRYFFGFSLIWWVRWPSLAQVDYSILDLFVDSLFR